MLLPELQILTSTVVTTEPVLAWCSERYPASTVHVGEAAPQDSKWTIWVRVEPSGHRDWPTVIVLAFTLEARIVGHFPEYALAAKLGALGIDCLVPPRDLVKHLPKNGGWSLALLGGSWALVDFRGDDAGPRGFWPASGAPRPVTLDVTRLEHGSIDFGATNG